MTKLHCWIRFKRHLWSSWMPGLVNPRMEVRVCNECGETQVRVAK